MISGRIKRRSLISAKSFAIGMVAVNVIGFVAAEHKMNSAEVPNAFALDDGSQPVVARRNAILPDRRELPELALTGPSPRVTPEPLPAMPVFKPLTQADLPAGVEAGTVGEEPAQASRADLAVAMAGSRPAALRPVRHVRLMPEAAPARSSGFDAAFGATAPSAEPWLGSAQPDAGLGGTDTAAVSAAAAQPALDGTAPGSAPSTDAGGPVAAEPASSSAAPAAELPAGLSPAPEATGEAPAAA